MMDVSEQWKTHVDVKVVPVVLYLGVSPGCDAVVPGPAEVLAGSPCSPCHQTPSLGQVSFQTIWVSPPAVQVGTRACHTVV